MKKIIYAICCALVVCISSIFSMAKAAKVVAEAQELSCWDAFEKDLALEYAHFHQARDGEKCYEEKAELLFKILVALDKIFHTLACNVSTSPDPKVDKAKLCKRALSLYRSVAEARVPCILRGTLPLEDYVDFRCSSGYQKMLQGRVDKIVGKTGEVNVEVYFGPLRKEYMRVGLLKRA